jgi:uncharacterized protein
VVVGALVAHQVPASVLKTVFGLGLLFLSGFLLFVPPPEECTPGEKAGRLITRRSKGKGITVIKARDGTNYRYPTCWRVPGVILAAIGGIFTGLISAGLPEISTTQLILRCKIPPRVAVATSVFVLAIAALAGATVHALEAAPVWTVVGWSIPGVLIGSLVGSRVGKKLPANIMEKSLGVVFATLGLLILWLQFGISSFG